jgi:transcriptional regulator with XRE-family HTH domain
MAAVAGMSRATVSEIERGHIESIPLRTIRLLAAVVDVRVDLAGRWRGGDAERLLNRRHSQLANRIALLLRSMPGWTVEPEVPFSRYGERGVIDQLAWHGATGHLLVIELKTEFVDINEMLGTLDRKARLGPAIAAERGWPARRVSSWVIVSDTRTNRRHSATHAELLRARLRLDGRQFRSFLRNPREATTGLAFWTDSSSDNARSEPGHFRTRVCRSAARSGAPGAADMPAPRGARDGATGDMQDRSAADRRRPNLAMPGPTDGMFAERPDE